MDAGRLATGTPAELLTRTASDSPEEAFIRLLPKEKSSRHRALKIPPRCQRRHRHRSPRSDHALRRFRRGGQGQPAHRAARSLAFFGSNGCGKTTTMKMLTGLLPASEGQALLFGKPVDPHDLQTRQRVGMSCAFSLYSELTVWQNLDLHARLFHLPAERREPRIREMLERFRTDRRGRPAPRRCRCVRQRLSLAVAVIHAPEMLILDEPTSGVDPVGATASGNSRAAVARGRRDHLHLHPLHERGAALRPHLADARRPRAGQRHAAGADAQARPSDP